MLVEALTDNRNRTGADVRHAFSKHGGNLGEPGSVAYLFDKKGVIVVDARALLRGRPDGRDRRRRARTSRSTTTSSRSSPSPSDLAAVRAALEAAGIAFESAEVTLPARRRASRSTSRRPRKLMRLIDTLEDNDDVGDVHANFEADADVLERVAAG